MTPSHLGKIDRYLDVTKSAFLFGGRTLLVAGMTEAMLFSVPAFTRHPIQTAELRSRRWLQSHQQTPIACQRQHLVFATVHRAWAVRDARQPPPATLVLVLVGELHFRILSTPTRAPPGRSRAERRAAACCQSPSPGAARTRPQRAAQPPGAGSPRACSSRRCLGSRGLRRRRRQCRAAPRLR